MAAIEGGFDANAVEPNDFEVLPAGEYLAVIEKSENKRSQSGDGEYHSLMFSIIEGPKKNRKLYDNITFKNKNAEAVRIGQGQKSALCRAVNVMTPRDTQEWHNIPLVIVVKVAKRKDTGEMTNKIAGYKNRNAASQQQSHGADASTPPWKRATPAT